MGRGRKGVLDYNVHKCNVKSEELSNLLVETKGKAQRLKCAEQLCGCECVWGVIVAPV